MLAQKHLVLGEPELELPCAAESSTWGGACNRGFGQAAARASESLELTLYNEAWLNDVSFVHAPSIAQNISGRTGF